MRKQIWLAVLTLLFVYALPASAQCGLYAYHDLWIDDSGNAVGDNYTQAVSCQGSSAYAEVHIAMPSGLQNGASASGSTTAEAVTQSSTAEAGEGHFSGINVASSYCWDISNETWFDLPVGYYRVTHRKTGQGSPCWTGPSPLNIQYCWYPVQPHCPNPGPYSFTDSQVKETKAVGDTAWGWLLYAACIRFPEGGKLCSPGAGPAVYADPYKVCDTK
jgi:hypothetical protein